MNSLQWTDRSFGWLCFPLLLVGIVAGSAIQETVAQTDGEEAARRRNNTREALSALASESASLATRLETAFTQLGLSDCAASPKLLVGDAWTNKTAFERGDLLQELTLCLDRVRGVCINTRISAGERVAEVISGVDESLESARAELEAKRQNNEAERDFYGLSWGVGFGISYGFEEIIEDAEIVQGVVRVTDDRTVEPRVVLEYHKYFRTKDKGNRTVGHGPFMAVVADQGDVLAGVGLGWMVGWRAAGDSSGDGFSVGIGAILDAGVRSFGDDFEENEPPPPGESTVRFEEKSRWSALLVLTRTF